jgi:hypothetical protein
MDKAMVELAEYFDHNIGVGVLSTADAQGRINSAIYARPHIQDDGTAAFVMRRRRTRANLEQNPHACYLFRTEGPGHTGRRLALTLVRTEDDPSVVQSMRRRQRPDTEDEPDRLVGYFRIDEVRPLVGD